MKFHNLHGSAITLSEGKTVATRSDAHFCNGVVFSDQPIKVGQKVSVELGYTNNWSGALRIGFTVNDPARFGTQELPKYAIPHLAKKEGYWVRPISENLTGEGYQLMFYISSDGNVQFFVNNEHKGALLVGLPVDKGFWVLFDIYGNTKGIKFVKPDDAPKEITARGPEAIKAFESACISGMRPVYRTRLMLVGQDGAGKTSLKKALLGQQNGKDETEETQGIDLSTSCTFCVGSHDSWTVTGANTQEVTQDDNKGIMGDVEALEEEYNEALASNIVQELLYQKRRKASVSQKQKPASRESQRGSAAKKFPGKPSSASITAKFNEIPTEMFKEVPDRVVELVQKMLDNSSAEVKSQDSVSIATKPVDGAKMVLNIWDFAGKEVYYATHQIFLTSRALYVFVFNLTHDLEEVTSESEEDSEKLSTLEYLDFWLRSIYAHASTTNKASETRTFSPPVLIVGTHKDCLHSETDLISKAVEEKFSQIQEFLIGKPYVQHLVTPFFAIDNTLEGTELGDLRKEIEDISCQEPYIGERMPIRWIRFEQEINTLKTQGTHYASYDQVTEVAGHLGVSDYREVMTMLEFYHDLGTIVYYGSGKSAIDNLLRNTVILDPQWLVDMFKHVISSTWRPEDKWNLIRDKWTRLVEFGVLEETLLETLWHEALDQKMLLLGLLEKFDLVCQRLPSVAESQAADYTSNRCFYVPARLSRYTGANKLYTIGENDVIFYINFHGFLPGGLFQRILTRTTRWSQDNGGQNPYFLYKQVVRFFLDTEHDFVLEMSPKKYSRIKVVVLRVSESETARDEKQTLDKLSPPRPEACAKVRNFLESSLCELREMWMKRISHTVCVRCPCERVCETHKTEGCAQESCLHFLNLDECIANKVVMCDHRRIRTGPIKKCFPEPLTLGFNGPVLPEVSLTDTCGNIEKHCPTLPNWVKSAAKLLNSGEVGKDLNALAKELGYKPNQINKFNDDLNPGLVLLTDWIISSGNTGLSVDMLTVYLEKIDRDDVVEIIQKAQELDHEPAQVFISYQWDSQDEVKVLRDRLERSGFMCWMDIGQLGGGDQLYTRIDEAVRQCKAVISCVSPKYVVSSHCMKEISLADLLRKPIIPVMIEKTVWPPPGGMALIFSQLVYINMKGVGGHGGTGIHADKNDKYKEIIQRISLYAVPDLSRCTDTETEAESKSQYIDHDILSSNYSVMEAGDRYSLGTRSSMNSAFTLRRVYGQDVAETVAVQRAAPRPVEEVHVHQCRICTIL
ncbi:uncharacterized protein LOC123523775 [Mercenaria mercenaria]|uniref:uncharacterized protein LOC123523775 n=1 Tax=Mercenaria mercenaria TaxID=6596 RepID=UPI00234E50F6|nr:uncharacterized protein LOC123523775 [Mercenaria mercenaria]